MFGFVIGALCLLAFVAVLGWRRGFGHPGCHGYFGRRGRFGLYRMLEELDTSPGQEKAIRAAVAELRGSLGELRPGLDEARRQLATLVRGEQQRRRLARLIEVGPGWV